jgi:hypothetical protein
MLNETTVYPYFWRNPDGKGGSQLRQNSEKNLKNIFIVKSYFGF